jgi:hypothetical protein
MQHLMCPVCGDTCVERLLNIEGRFEPMSVCAFRCTENAHIFFIRAADFAAPTANEIRPLFGQIDS